jgi:hypothetical protein
MLEDHKFDGRPQVDLLRRTETGTLQSWYYGLREDMEVIDGDGEIFTFPQGARILVVDMGGVDHALVERAVDRAELGIHNTYAMRPAREKVRTPFDIRTPQAGGRGEDDQPI